MTALSAMRDAAMICIKRKPDVFFSSQGRVEQEFVTLLNMVARDIAESNDWQRLTKIAELNGDGVASSFPFPADYDRMVQASSMADGKSWFLGYTHVTDINDWIAFKRGAMVWVPPGIWTILSNKIEFMPPVASSSQALMPYISKNMVRAQDGTLKSTFTADTDEFLLSERVLTLGLIWRWREANHLDSTGDQLNFEKELSTHAARDKGARVIRRGGTYDWPFPWRF